MAIDLGSLRQALATLERAMGALQPPERFEALDADIQETLQAGVIQSFEFSYELSWKYMERWLRENADSLEAAPRTRKDLFRAAARRGQGVCSIVMLDPPQKRQRQDEQIGRRRPGSSAACAAVIYACLPGGLRGQVTGGYV